MACDECGAKRGHVSGCTKGKSIRKVEPKGGSKKVSQKWRQRLVWVTCPTCKGSGKRGIRKCGLCDGAGQIKALEE